MRELADEDYEEVFALLEAEYRHEHLSAAARRDANMNRDGASEMASPRRSDLSVSSHPHQTEGFVKQQFLQFY